LNVGDQSGGKTLNTWFERSDIVEGYENRKRKKDQGYNW